MALTPTTLAGGMSANDTEVLLTSIAGLAVGQQIVVDQETMRALNIGLSAAVPVQVTRGLRGSNVVAHPAGARATFGPSVDFSVSKVGGAARRDIVSYSVSGAIALPTPGVDRIAILNGTVALNMTVAAPGLENDGDLLVIVGNGKAAHVVTVAGGLGAVGSAVDALTMAAGGQNSVALVAANGAWVPFGGSVLAGTLTNITVTAA
jgi:hypothetical protein